MAWVNVIGAGASLLGAMDSGDQQQSTEQKKTPWEPAQPWMKQNLETGQNLQRYMEQNPFNQTQKTGYDNLLGGVDQFNSQIAPGLYGMANNLAGSSYSRQRGGAPGSAAGYGGAVQPGGMSQRSANIFPTQNTNQQYGRVNWDAANPFSKNNPNGINSTPATAAPSPTTGAGLEGLTPQQLNKLLQMLGNDNSFGGLLNIDSAGGGL